MEVLPAPPTPVVWWESGRDTVGRNTGVYIDRVETQTPWTRDTDTDTDTVDRWGLSYHRWRPCLLGRAWESGWVERTPCNRARSGGGSRGWGGWGGGSLSRVFAPGGGGQVPRLGTCVIVRPPCSTCQGHPLQACLAPEPRDPEPRASGTASPGWAAQTPGDLGGGPSCHRPYRPRTWQAKARSSSQSICMRAVGKRVSRSG